MKSLLEEVVIAVVIIGFAIFIGFRTHASRTVSWQSVLAQVQAKHPSLDHIKGADLEALMKSKKPLLVLDIRAPKEFAISHLKDAVLVDPIIRSKELIHKLKGKLAGRTIVFYCSVGMRSSALAARVKPMLLQGGAAKVYNLHRGLFGWGNKKRPMYNANGATKFVHPFDQNWGVLLNQALWKGHS